MSDGNHADAIRLDLIYDGIGKSSNQGKTVLIVLQRKSSRVFADQLQDALNFNLKTHCRPGASNLVPRTSGIIFVLCLGMKENVNHQSFPEIVASPVPN